MSNDKTTLADVQPGGRVRLGDQAERAQFEAWVKNHVSSLARAADGDYASNFTHALWSAWQAALSAQPSPATCKEGLQVQPSPDGQDARAQFEEYRGGDCERDPQGYYVNARTAQDWAMWQAALAARQPVGATDQSYNSGGIELTACQLHEALLMAGSLELDVPFEDRGRVRIFQNETGHSGSGLYCECVDAEEQGCILLDGSSPAIAPTAQAVGLGAERTFYIQDTRQFVGNCPMWWGPNGSGYATRLDEAGRYTEQEAIKQNRTRNTDIPWPCEEIDAIARSTVDFQHMRPRAERLAELALIDRQTVSSD